MNPVAEVVVPVALLLGCLLTLLAAVGLLRLSDLLARMHTTAKPQVLGVLLSLVAVGLQLHRATDVAMIVAIGAFQLLTVPVAAHVVGRAAYRTGQVDPSVLAHDDLADDLARGERPAG
ncbi:monovalent cation/H(+) antiporter subunit G [Kineococcus aurantiacus]|uniref:Multicomponent Na+:H+ antiporter subunit G n=1 Tax=Kineococcus aurantiacus TaxID=37633 RepID=A0A7Y9DLK7_9ACTN|nr:multicomponent Na+:H+ antiporter subunit G [Kineococcus aurantiacus]